MTMVAGKWQQPRKQRLHQRRKQRPSGGGDTVSGIGENIGTTMTATTGDEDYDAGRALDVVDDGDWYDDFDHEDDDGSCYDEDNHDDDRRKGGGRGGAENRAGGGGRGQRWQRRRQWQRRG